MPNPYYDHTTYPTPNAPGSSAQLRAELDLIEAGFDKLPTLTGNANKVVVVNSGETALTATSTLSGLTLSSPAFTGTPTAPTAAAGTNTTQIATTAHVFAERSNTATLTNKTFNLANNTFVATSAQLAAAITDESGSGALLFANSPAMTGTPTAPTAAPGTNNTQVATTAFVATGFAPSASPAFTGTPTAPTASLGTSTTQLATTAFVAGTAFSSALPAQTGNAGKFVRTDGITASWASTGFDQALALLGNTRNQFFTATGTFVVPSDVSSIRAYAFGPGGAGANFAVNQSGGGGGGGGCAYGDIAVTPGDTVTITISGSSTTVAIGATTYLTANAGNNASGTTGGTGGTASKHASVTNGGAVTGQEGGVGGTGGANLQVSGGGGGASGSPLGAQSRNLGDGFAATTINVAMSGGGGGGWGGSGAIGRESTAATVMPSFGGGVGSGSDNNRRAGGSSSSNGEGRGLFQLFSDPLLRPLTGAGGSAFSPTPADATISPPGLGGGGASTARSVAGGSIQIAYRGSFGGGGAGGAAAGTGNGSIASTSLFGGGGGGSAASTARAYPSAPGGLGGGGGGGGGYSASAANGEDGSAGGSGAVFILY